MRKSTRSNPELRTPKSSHKKKLYAIMSCDVVMCFVVRISVVYVELNRIRIVSCAIAVHKRVGCTRYTIAGSTAACQLKMQIPQNASLVPNFGKCQWGFAYIVSVTKRPQPSPKSTLFRLISMDESSRSVLLNVTIPPDRFA